jgi:DNA segregation ATPase FtsK/SpoIIIE-like protein
VDAAKPMSDWRTAYFRNYIVPENRSFESPVRLPIGVDLDGVLIDINLSSHNLGRLLVGGSPGGGKSNFGVAALCAVACQYSPDSVRLLLSDVQQVELEPFKKLPHLYAPVANTPEETVEILRVAESDMDARQALFAAVGAKNIDGYNAIVPPNERLPRIVILIEEMADIIASPSAAEFNELQNRFLRLGRKWGFYWIGSTQTPRRDVIPPEIRALYAAFLAFMCTRPSESKILLGEQDESAAQLLGYGDGIFMSNLGSDRVQTLLVEPNEVKAIVDRVIASYGSYQPPKPRVFENNNLDATRKRLEDALNLPFFEEDGEPADIPTNRPTNQPTDQPTNRPTNRPTNQPTESDEDSEQSAREKFERIKVGRSEGRSKSHLIQELFEVPCDGGNVFKRAELKYYEIINTYAREWIVELLESGCSLRKVVEIVWSHRKTNLAYPSSLAIVEKISREEGLSNSEEG